MLAIRNENRVRLPCIRTTSSILCIILSITLHHSPSFYWLLQCLIVRPLNDGQRKYVARNNRIRRVMLDGWEVTNPNMCWLAIWMAFREKPIVTKLVSPTFLQE